MWKGKKALLGGSLIALSLTALFIASAASPAMTALLSGAGGALESGSTSGRGAGDGVASPDAGNQTDVSDSEPNSPEGVSAPCTKCCARSTRANEIASAAKRMSVLSGRVYDLESGAPISGALVILHPLGFDDLPPPERPPVQPEKPPVPPEEPPMPPNRPPVPPEKPPVPPEERPVPPDKPPLPPDMTPRFFKTRTDEKGFYSIKLPPGRYRAHVEAEGFLPANEPIGVPPGTKLNHDFTLRPAPARVLVLRIVWGYLEYNPEGTFKAWDGFLSVTSGKIKVLRTIRFDAGGDYATGGDDRVYERSAPNVVSWRSSTTVHNDGILVALIIPPTDGPVWVTLHTASWSATVNIQRVVGLHTVIDVDDTGRQISVDCEPARKGRLGPEPVETPVPPDEPETPLKRRE